MCEYFAYRHVGRPPCLSLNDERALASWARWCYSCDVPQYARTVRAKARKIAQARQIPFSKKCVFGTLTAMRCVVGSQINSDQ